MGHPLLKTYYICHHCGRQNHRILTPFELGGPPEMPNKCITTNLPPHQYLRWGASIFKKTHSRNGGNKIFDRSHIGMGYASYMCLAATFANLPICTIFDTYFTVLAPFAKNIYIRHHCRRRNHRILTPLELGGPPEMPNKCINNNLPQNKY